MAQTKRLNPRPLTGVPHGKHYEASKPLDPYTRTVGKAIGLATNYYGKVLTNPVASQVTSGIANKGWRALLFTNRAHITHQVGPVADKKTLGGDNAVTDPAVLTTSGNSIRPRMLRVYTQGEYDIAVGEEIREKSEGRYRHRINEDFPKDFTYISLTGRGKRDEDNKVRDNKVIIYNETALSRGEKEFIELQHRPIEIEASPESTWAAIKSMGRNNPMYHYIGGEDSLHINTSWRIPGIPGEPSFNPYWVINRCRLLESWSKANGYISAPPILSIEWGNSDIFRGSLWILTSATYRLTSFNDKTIVIPRFYGHVDNSTYINKQVKPEVIDAGLVPYTATQELIFKRVASNNLLSDEIHNYMEPVKDDDNL